MQTSHQQDTWDIVKNSIISSLLVPCSVINVVVVLAVAKKKRKLCKQMWN